MSELPLLSRAGLLRGLAFFVALFVAFALLEHGDLFSIAHYTLERRDIPNPALNTLFIVGLYLLCILSLAILYLHKWRAVRWLAYALTLVTVITYVEFRRFNGYGFTYHEASLFWAEVAFIDEAVGMRFAGGIGSVLLVLAILVAFERWGRPRLPSFRSLLWLAVPCVALYAYQELLEITYTKVYQMPTPFRVTMLLEHTYRHRIPYYGRREAPFIAPVRPAVADHILYIVDESVSGDMLHINGAPEDTTPFLDSMSQEIFNYGVAMAPSNLSSTSNIVYQSGLRADQIPDRELRALKNPNIFSYAQQAGFKAFIIDAQIYSDKPTNLMTGFDLEALDEHIYVRPLEVGLPGWEMDMRAIDYIEEIVDSNDRTFIYLVKSGAHFPYERQYPPEETHFTPTLLDREGNLREKALNTYRNALRWSVDGFLRRVYERFREKNARMLVIYTADHGQSLSIAARDSEDPDLHWMEHWPHALPVAPPRQQAAVPLLFMPITDDVTQEIRTRYQPELYDRVTGFELFPTILELTGYDYPAIRDLYGPSLFDAEAPRGPRRFVSGNLFGYGGDFYQNRLIEDDGYLNDFDEGATP